LTKGLSLPYYYYYYYYYYNHFTASWTLSRTTRVSQYQKGKTRKIKPIWTNSTPEVVDKFSGHCLLLQ